MTAYPPATGTTAEELAPEAARYLEGRRGLRLASRRPARSRAGARRARTPHHEPLSAHKQAAMEGVEALSVWPVAQQLAREQRRRRYLPESNAHPGKMLLALAREAISRYT
jgi:hypothetical protein